MKKIFVLLICLSWVTVFSQQTDDFTLGVIFKFPTEKINEIHLSKLETKLSNVISTSNMANYGYNNDFVILSTLNIDDTSVVEGGMENMTVTTIDVTFSIIQLTTQKSFNITSKKIKGSGKNESQAINNAFNQIKSKDKELIQFIEKDKNNIYEYFKNNCNSILNKAETLYKTQDYEQAISILQSIPQFENNCYDKAQGKIMEYYKAYQSKLCKENITKAKSEIALQNYNRAVLYLNMIDSDSDCFSEVEKILPQISNKIKEENKQQIDRETRRMNAVKEIAKAYYSNLAKSSYYVIVR